MPNFNATSSLVAGTFNYANTFNTSTKTLSVFAILGVASNIGAPLSGNGTNATAVSAFFNLYAGYGNDYTYVPATSTTTVSLTAITPPTLTFPSANGNQITQGFVSFSSHTTGSSAFSISVDFDEPDFYLTTISLSGNVSTVIDNGTVTDVPFYQNSDSVVKTGVINNATVAGLSSTNLILRTAGRHASKWGGQNG